jgi:plasmid stability protein
MAELSIKNFPEDLLRRLKVGAAAEGITLRELIISRLEIATTTLKRKAK